MTAGTFPVHWRRLKIAQVLRPLPSGKLLQQGWSPQCEKEPSPDDNTWGVLKTTAIQPGEFLSAENKRLPDRLSSRPAIEVHTGDLLMTCAGPRKRCAVPCLVKGTRPRLMMSGKMYRFRADESIMEPRFLELALLEPDTQRSLDKMKTGISDSGLNLTQSRFLELELAVPPVDEQRRIVDILEDHLSRLDAADSALDAAHRRSDLLRSVTLNCLAPDEMSLATLGDLSVDSGYGTSTKCVVDGPGVPVVRIPNLVGGRIELADEKRVADPSVDLTHLMLAQDDLLIVRTNGSRDLIGRAAVVGSEIHASFASYLIRFKVDMAQARPQWVRIMLGAPSQRRVLEAMAASSAGQYNLGLKKLNRVPIPCPSLDRQDQLLLRFDDQEWAQHSLTRSLDTGRARSQSLRRSLLAAAFSGRLTGRTSDMEMVGEMAGV